MKKNKKNKGHATNQYCPNLLGTSPVIAVNHKDEALRVLEVMSPQRTDFVLTAHVPDSETDVLVFNSLDVEP